MIMRVWRGMMMADRAEAGRDEVAVDHRSERWLRGAFLAGAFTDALVLIPLLHPGIARLLWDIQTGGGAQRFVAHSAAALMAGWTMLLWWASRRPLERRDVAVLTLVVIAGLILDEVAAVTESVVPMNKMIPTWVVQFVLVGGFSGAYLRSCSTGRR